jgi:hypothetical protein
VNGIAKVAVAIVAAIAEIAATEVNAVSAVSAAIARIGIAANAAHVAVTVIVTVIVVTAIGTSPPARAARRAPPQAARAPHQDPRRLQAARKAALRAKAPPKVRVARATRADAAIAIDPLQWPPLLALPAPR